MSENVCLLLLIICVIFSPIIVAISSDKNITKSPDLLFRKKRVLNHENDADATIRINEVPYVVQIKKLNRPYCVGSILSHQTVITAATCLIFEIAAYKVNSGALHTSRGRVHNVTEKKIHFSNSLPRARARDGVGLITVNPPFIFTQFTNKIDLHDGLILPNTLGTVAGWGFIRGRGSGTLYPERLRTISVPIMNHRECVNTYSGFANITDKEICTFHPNKHCGHTDIGAALVIDNSLVGIHLWGGQIATINRPDIFLLVQHYEYRQWIRANIV